MVKTTGKSLKADRELIAMAMDLAAIVKKTGRRPQSILKSAKRLSLSIKGSKTISG